MSIWDVVGNVLEKKQSADNEDKPDKDKKPPLIATTFTANFGDTITTLMGGGRFTNLIGSDAKVVFDWEEFGVEPTGMLGKVFSAFMGLGGDALMVYGNKTAFHYSGIPFTSRRGEKPPITFSDTATMNLEEAAKRKGVFITVGVGIAAIVALSVTVRVKYSNFPMNKEKTELEEPDDELAKNLICGFYVICEDRWLLSLRYLDIGFQMAFLFKNTITAAKARLKEAKSAVVLADHACREFNARDGRIGKAAFNAADNVFRAGEELTAAQAEYDKMYIRNNTNLKCYLE